MSSSQPSSAASQETHDLARRLFDAGDIVASGKIYGDILSSSPDDSVARSGLRECASGSTISDRSRFVRQVISTVYRGSRFINDAMPGWLYSQLIEGKFVDGDLKKIELLWKVGFDWMLKKAACFEMNWLFNKISKSF